MMKKVAKKKVKQPISVKSVKKVTTKKRELPAPTNQKFSGAEEELIKSWIAKQRYKYKKGELTPDQIKSLENLPDWNWKNRTKFDSFVNGIKNYYGRMGDLNIPLHHREAGKNLRNWIYNVKRKHTAGRLDDYEITALESIPGWDWTILRYNKPAVVFEDMLVVAKAYLMNR